MEKKDAKIKKNVKISTMILTAVIAVIGYIFVIGVLIYGFGFNNPIAQKTAAIIPYPAAFVGTEILSINDLYNRTASAKKFYENQDFSSIGMRVDFNTDEGKKRLKIKERAILNKMIEDRIIEKEAKRRNIEITNDVVSQEVDRKMKEYGSENYLKENLSRLYGWNIQDFENYIVKPDMYRQKLIEDIRTNDQNFKQAKNNITKAKNELKPGSDFGVVVKKYSDGDSAKNSGSLGWFSADQMLPEISVIAFSLDKGKTSDIIESALGYHIIKIEDKKNDNGKDMVKISQIFVRTKTVGDILTDLEKKESISVPVKDFYWDREKLSVEFKNSELKKFEENIQQNSSNDASMLF
jgi:foldase protein PrsA